MMARYTPGDKDPRFHEGERISGPAERGRRRVK